MSRHHTRTALPALAIVGLLCALTPAAECAEPELERAWKAFNESRYEQAIVHAEECIRKFENAADRTQADLLAEKVPEPPTGAVSDVDKKRIFERGLLNDVATAWWIKARSAAALKERGGEKAASYGSTATEAYRAVCRYPYGRTWDPKGWFWSPCEDAKRRSP